MKPVDAQPATSEVSLHVCPKCQCARTRSVSTTRTAYYRCDACEYVFRPPTAAKPARAVASLRKACTQCGSGRTRVIGRSAPLPLIHIYCDDCGYLSSSSIN